MIGWPLSCPCAVACLFGDESQQPIFPHVMHIRRCTQPLPIFRHSSQPARCSGTVVTSIWSRWLQIEPLADIYISPRLSGNRRANAKSPPMSVPTAGTSSESDTELGQTAEDERGDHRPFSDCSGNPLGRAVADVPCGKEPD